MKNIMDEFIEKNRNRELPRGKYYGFSIGGRSARLHIHAKTFDKNDKGIILYDTDRNSIVEDIKPWEVIDVFSCSIYRGEWELENILYDSEHGVKINGD